MVALNKLKGEADCKEIKIVLDLLQDMPFRTDGFDRSDGTKEQAATLEAQAEISDLTLSTKSNMRVNDKWTWKDRMKTVPSVPSDGYGG